jgi:hypothetical protein
MIKQQQEIERFITELHQKYTIVSIQRPEIKEHNPEKT